MSQKGDIWSKFNRKTSENPRKLAKTLKMCQKSSIFGLKIPKRPYWDPIEASLRIFSTLAPGDLRVGGMNQKLSQIHPGGPPGSEVYGKVPKKRYMAPHLDPPNPI